LEPGLDHTLGGYICQTVFDWRTVLGIPQSIENECARQTVTAESDQYLCIRVGSEKQSSVLTSSRPGQARPDLLAERGDAYQQLALLGRIAVIDYRSFQNTALQSLRSLFLLFIARIIECEWHCKLLIQSTQTLALHPDQAG